MTSTKTTTAFEQAPVVGATRPIDDEGRCISHPFVQLQRLSIVSGKWKTLLDCCPLCAMDNKATTSLSCRSECSSICSGGGDEISSSKARATTTKTTTRAVIDYDFCSSSPPLQSLHSRVVRRSRVRFQPEKELFTTTTTTTATTLDDLFHSQQHYQGNHLPLHTSNNIKRSMSSSSLPAQFISSGSSVSSSMSKSALKATPRYKVCEKRMQQQLDDCEKVTTMSMDMDLGVSTDDVLISSSNSESKKVHNNEEEEEKEEEIDPDDALPTLQAEMVLPDPEEFPCYTPQQTTASQRHQAMLRSSSPSAQQGWSYLSPYQTKTTDMMMMQSLQASPSIKARSSSSRQHPKQHQHQPIDAHNIMVIDPTPDYDDEVSTLNSTGYSVQSPKQGPSSSSSSYTTPMAYRHHPVEDNASLSTNTNDCDDTGRCIHHPHIRLRKKKLFGKGWKVLMSACPDCCVNELHRIRAVAENKARIQERKSEGSSRRSIPSSLSNRSDNNDCDEEDRCTTPRRGCSSSKGSSSSRAEDEGRRTRSTSRNGVRSSSSSSSSRRHGRAYGNEQNHQDQDSTTAPSPSFQDNHHCRTPSAPPKRSPSLKSTGRHHHHHQQSQTASSSNANNTKFLHRESDETTASLTGSSSGSSNEITTDNSDRTGSLSSSGEAVQSSRQKNVNIANLRKHDSNDGIVHMSKRIVDTNNSERHHSQHERQEEEQQLPRGTIQVRKMEWTDPKNGQVGLYTGQVNTHFIPHGYGVMKYSDRTLSAKDGKWKEGRHRKSSSSSSSSSKKGVDGRSRSRSASRSRSQVMS